MALLYKAIKHYFKERIFLAEDFSIIQLLQPEFVIPYAACIALVYLMNKGNGENNANWTNADFCKRSIKDNKSACGRIESLITYFWLSSEECKWTLGTHLIWTENTRKQNN